MVGSPGTTTPKAPRPVQSSPNAISNGFFIFELFSAKTRKTSFSNNSSGAADEDVAIWLDAGGDDRRPSHCLALDEGVNDEVVHNDILEIKNRLADVGEVVRDTFGVLCQRQVFRSY